MLSGRPRRLWPDAVVHHGARWLLVLGLSVGLVLLYPSDPSVLIGRHEAGTVAERDIIAVAAFDIPKDSDVLRAEREAAASAVIPTFIFQDGARESASTALARFFADVDSAAAVSGVAGIGSVLAAAGIDAGEEQVETLADPARAESIRESAAGAIDGMADRGIIAPGAASEVTTESLRVVRRGGASVVPRASVLSGREFYDAVLADREPGVDTDLLRLVLARYMVPSLAPDAARNARERAAARDSISVTAGRVLEGEAIVRANDQVGPAELQKLEAYRNHLRTAGIPVDESNVSGAFGGLILNAMILSIFGGLLFFHRPDIFREFRYLQALAAITALYFAGAFFVARLAFPGPVLPTVFVTVALAILWDGRLALVSLLVLSALTAAQEPFASVDTFFVALAGGAAAALAVRSFRRLSQTWLLIAITFGAYALVLAAVMLRGADFEFLPALGWALLGTIAWSMLAIGFLPAFEWMTGRTTDQTLISWADPNRPLIKQLATEAPGTYAHTIQVANLAEAGANDIGANAALCRAGAYYHDVGKMVHPDLFIENQSGDNPHDTMTPDASAAVVRGHVIEGVRMARREKVPEVIVDFISEHHGDQTISFFLDKASENAEKEGRDPPDPARFRYPGPRPKSRETAIVMLADSVESATRAMNRPDRQRITRLIQQIFAGKLDRGQLDNAALTLKDLTLLRKRFLKILAGIHHRRIEYPGTRHLTAESPGSGDPEAPGQAAPQAPAAGEKAP